MIREKTRQLLESFIAELPESYREIYNEIAEYSISLGYTPKIVKTNNLALNFSKSKIKRTILKLELHGNSNKKNPPGLRLKFYANKYYSDIFIQGIKSDMEKFDGKYNGCFSCGKCENELEGYTYIYENGKKVFLCGKGLISIPNFNQEHIDEIKMLMKKQDDYFIKNLL